jgi:hypothetical protein
MSGPREESLGHYEMLWDCPHCDTKKLLGKTHRHCPHCGAPQDASKRYFPSDADKIRVEDHQFTGTDRSCGSCGTPQSAKAEHCGQCGAPLSDAKAVPLVSERPAAAPRPKRNYLWWILAALLVGGFLIWFQCIRTKSVGMVVTGHRWTTAIEVEEYREVSDEAWRDEIPTGARHVSCHTAQRSTRSVPDGETCRDERVDKGDGTFEVIRKCTPKTREVPVNDQRCRFQIDRWTKVDELKQEGQGLTTTWATMRPSPVQSGQGARREGARRAVYILELNDGKRPRTCEVSEATWRKLADRQNIKADVRAGSGELVCSSL